MTDLIESPADYLYETCHLCKKMKYLSQYDFETDNYICYLCYRDRTPAGILNQVRTILNVPEGAHIVRYAELIMNSRRKLINKRRK